MSTTLQKVKSLFQKSNAKLPSETIKIEIPKFEKPNLLYWLGLIPVFVLALFIRTRNLPLLQGKYLIELDSYFFFRYAKMLLEQGYVPAVDMMRYVPVGTPTAGALFFPKTLVAFYKVVHIFFPNLSQIEWHIIYPPVITIVSFVFFFLFVKTLLNSYRIAFIATAFLAVIPAYLQRTMAGFADHEAVAMLWMFISLWLFTLAWKSESWKGAILLAGVSGLFAGLMAATWGGYILFIASIALFILVYSALTNRCKSSFLRGLPWAVVYFFSGTYFSAQTVVNFAKVLPNVLLLFTLFFLLIHLVLQCLPKFNKFTIIPNQFVSLLITISAALIVNFVVGLVNLKEFIGALTKETVNRVFWTVSENAQPYFTDWWSSFGGIFLLAFVGSALFFYSLFKPESYSKFRLQLWASFAYVVFFFAFIFGRFSPNPKFPIITNFFSNTYLYWLAGFVIVLGALYLISYYKAPEHLHRLERGWPWLFLGIWFLLVLLAARGQIRVMFATVPPVAIAASFFISKAMDWAKMQKKALKYSVLVALLLVSVFTFGFAAQQTALQNKYSGSMVPGQWGDAMTWIRENTPPDAVFTHWWDYGYLTIVVGQRATVTDGGHGLAWDHASGRYFLTGKDLNSTLTYLKSHNVTHFLISQEEIPKYHAFSFIGSDENLDRQSTIGIFVLSQRKEVRNGTLFVYVGGWPFDKDYVLGKLVLSKHNAGIGGFSFVIGNNNSITEPKAYIIVNGQQFEVPISCIVVQGQKLLFEADNSIRGCLQLVPYFDKSGKVELIGGAFWLSEKVWDTNFARFYLYNETSPYFKLVYQDEMPLGIYQNRVIGPIKIWEVHYPESIKSDPFYLELSKYG
ncbi:MAG: STT3 domain-containing protein [Candidatus Nanoarchaeia archaeon]